MFVLSHGRPNTIKTIDSLRTHGYTGKIYIILDNEDKTIPQYIENYGQDKVLIFDKEKVANEMDTYENFGDRRSVLFARYANFQIAKDLGVEYFMQLDDDYINFSYRFNHENVYFEEFMYNLDDVINAMIKFLDDSGFKTVCMAQSGDFIGGEESTLAKKIGMKRKAMNSFLCCTDNVIRFEGLLNDDVNTYLKYGKVGEIFGTINQVSLRQLATQQNPGGISEMYIEKGTYVKSFYSIMANPSCVGLMKMGMTHKRIHHSVKWDNAVPKIMRQKHSPNK